MWSATCPASRRRRSSTPWRCCRAAPRRPSSCSSACRPSTTTTTGIGGLLSSPLSSVPYSGRVALLKAKYHNTASSVSAWGLFWCRKQVLQGTIDAQRFYRENGQQADGWTEFSFFLFVFKIIISVPIFGDIFDQLFNFYKAIGRGIWWIC